MRMLASTVTFVIAVGLACDGAGVTPPPDLAEPLLAPEVMYGTLQWADVGSNCSASSPAIPLSSARRQTLPTVPANERTVNDEFASYARAVPGGWGGYFLQEGTPTLWLVDPSKRSAAVEALHDRGLTQIPTDVSVIPGRWNFAQMYDWYRWLKQEIADTPNLIGTDVQESANRIQFFVAHDSLRAVLDARLVELGTPCRLVAVGVSEPIVPR